LFGVVEKVVQRRVSPLQPSGAGQVLEPVEVFLGDGLHRFLVGRVAIIDPAAERTRLAGRAQVVFLERAKVGRDGLLIRRGGTEEDVRFHAAQKKDVAIFLEPATAATGDADRTGGPDFLIDLPVYFQYLAAD
jgi:hypothetical protein